jgi:alpha/beta superfamily hydrolase
MFQGDSMTRLLQGAAFGAIAAMFVGFYFGGWVLGGTAEKMANQQSEHAVVAALAPVCAEKFRAQSDLEAKKAALTKADSWKRSDQFPKEWVTLPGQSYVSSDLVAACSKLVLATTSAAL